MKKLFIIPILLVAISAFSQYKPKKGGGLYSTGQNSVDKGWYFGLGATYILGYLNEKKDVSYNDTLNNSYNNHYIGDPKGKFGLAAQIGLFRMNDRKVINYIDYGLQYKWFRGGEDYTNEFSRNDTLLTTTTAEGSYSDHLISGHFNFGYRYDASETKFFVNALGLNLDYAIIKGRSGTPPIPTIDYKDGPGSLLGELHYIFGIGFKTGKRLIIMPTIETPIFAILPFRHIVSTHPYFNTRARPFIISIRFMFLKKGSKSCPAVYNPMGIDPNGNLTK